MNVVDLLFALLIVSAVAGGWRLGLIARVASWIGALGGLYLAVRGLPWLLREMGNGPATTRLLTIVAGILFGAAVGGAVGELAGRNLRRIVPPGPARTFDHAGGAVAGAVGILVSTWLLLPVLGDVPGSVARLTRNSRVLAYLDEHTPPPPDAMRVLRSFLGDARFPQVFEELRPAPDTGPPPSQLPLSAATLAKVEASTVNIEAVGCGAIHEGSGFAVASETVVTNAHVVAGATRVRVRRPDQKLFTARVILFDDNRDLAILSAPGLAQVPLAVIDSKVGAQGAVIGYPGGQNLPRPAPALIRDASPASGRDIYGQDRTTRQVLFLAASLRPGDSGGALVDPSGRVMGVAFAIAPDRPGTAYALDSSELRAALAEPRRPGTGPCP